VTATRRLASLAPLAPNASVAPDAVVFQSRGVVLVIGDGPAITTSVSALAKALKVVAFAPGLAGIDAGSGSVTAVGGRVLSLSGALGAFHAQAATPGGGSADIGRFSPNADGTFDLVLDLSGTPLLTRSIAPLGYFAPQGDQAALAHAMAELRRLVGRFAKPRFVEYHASLCTHGAQGLRGCTQCLQVCPAGAIRSAGDIVELDTRLCQGCGGCALACPTGALSFNRPSPAVVRASLRRLLDAARSDGSPVIVAHVPVAGAAMETARLPARARTFQIDALPAFGEELWFEALASGAAGVVLVRDSSATIEEQTLLDRKIAEARTLLGGCGISPLRLALVDSGALVEVIDTMPQQVSGTSEPAAASAAKRPALLAALDALHAASVGAMTPVVPGAPVAPVALMSGMPYGEVAVDRAKCTLCFACANLCPTTAFVAAPEPTPRLRFVEARCVQCGLCEVGCPERAITLHPRFMIDAAARSEARMLHEDELFRCTECGTPFISRRLLASSLERLKGHPVLDEQGTERLKMCPACRQRATMKDSLRPGGD
jgi:ferredoxin